MMIFWDAKPKSASIVLTTKCNGKCGMCRIWKLESAEIEFNQAVKIIMDLKSFGINTINLLGGEPLLYDKLFELAKIIKSKNIRCTLITNGLLIGQQNIADIKKFFDYVAVSIDGSSKEIYERIRNGASFEKALGALTLIKQYAIPCDMRYTMQSGNVNDVNNAVNLAESLGVNILFGFAENRGVGNAQGGICKRVEAQELIGWVSRIDSPMFLNKKRTFEIIASRLEGRQAHFKCRSPYNYIFIFATCDVYPCSVIDEKMGNLRENKIKDIFFSRQFVRMRRSIKNGKNEVCKTCTHGCEIDASIRR